MTSEQFRANQATRCMVRDLGKAVERLQAHNEAMHEALEKIANLPFRTDITWEAQVMRATEIAVKTLHGL